MKKGVAWLDFAGSQCQRTDFAGELARNCLKIMIAIPAPDVVRSRISVVALKIGATMSSVKSDVLKNVRPPDLSAVTPVRVSIIRARGLVTIQILVFL